MKRWLIAVAISISSLAAMAQSGGKIAGTVVDKTTQQPVSNATVELSSTKKTITDSLGKFALSNVAAGTYNVTITAIGYTTYVAYNNVLNTGNTNELNIELQPSISNLESVTVKSNTTRKTAKAATLETPLSVQRLTTEEIRANPGGNFDISKVIQSLPGVGGGVAGGGFRNDIIIRGGAPNENVFYLDGIELPTINHFATQGAGGGPQGILNVSFIEDVKLSTSAFDAKFDNTLSSVFEFKQKRGNANKVQGNVRLSATELAGTLEGPLSKGKKPTTFLASVRRSYLQLLFSAIDLPIRPNYWDFQFKTTTQLSTNTTLTLLGVGAIDRFSFAAPKEATPEKLFVLNSNPSVQQNSYTVGASIKHLLKKGFWNLALSRNVLDNNLTRYSDNLNPTPANQTLDVKSIEAENKLRFDVNTTVNGFKITYGAAVQYAQFSNNTFARISFSPSITNNFSTAINFTRLGAFVQVGKRFFNNRLGVSAGLRSDANTFTTDGMNALQTLSPRVSFNYVLADKWNLNASVGRYARLAPYSVLGYKNNAGSFVNKNADYTMSNHYVAGIEHLPTSTTRFTIEGFYKQYSNVPISVRNGISLANLGSDFNVLGNEAVTTNGKGRTYGFEFFAQQKLTKRFFGIFSYTFYTSEYTNAAGNYIPSAWDNRHLISFTWGYKFPKNWELGLKFRFQGGAPYTPFDMVASQANYLTLGEGILDFNRLNTQRLNSFNSSDVRIDKKWNFKKTTLDLFLDVTNWYVAKVFQPDSYTFKRNDANTAFVTTNGQPIQQNGSNAIPLLLSNNDASVLPTIGFIVEF
jgi:TonB dependent receptor/Carboxypeptidase regulatory-like domain/TonB-dependent Receptor Plug Domain